MKFINKKRAVAIISAMLVASTSLWLMPAYAGIDEVLNEGDYKPPLAKEVEIIKAPSISSNEVAVNGVQMEYTVRPGDTLWRIAERTGVSVDELAAANKLEQDNLVIVGRKLTIPGGKVRIHKVAAGETLIHIAGQYGVSLQELMSLNNISNPDSIKIDLTLEIPTKSSVTDVPALASGQTGRIQIGGWTWPVAGEITSNFGIRGDRPHEGVDIGAFAGSTIVAPEKGKVVWSGLRGTYGLTVIIDHGNGLRSLYAHCSKLLVYEGQWVNKNQTIAKVGNTGRSEGPHLHMEILRQGIPIDPLMFLKDRLFG